MSNTYTWTVTAMDAYPTSPQPDCVFCVHWNATATDGTHTASVYNTCQIPYNAQDPYIPYAQLTQAEVLGWIHEHGVDQTATQEALDTMIANLVNPPVVTPKLPWSV